MNAKDCGTYDGLRRVRRFLRQHPAWFRAIWSSPVPRAIDEAIRIICQVALLRWTLQLHDDLVQSRIHMLRDDVRTSAMRPVIAVARERLRGELTLGALKLPKRHANLASFIRTARELADVVDRFQDAFEREGLQPGTAKRLHDAARELAIMQAKRVALRAGRVAMGKRIDDELRRARGTLALLDAFVPAALGRNDAGRALWAELRSATDRPQPEYRLRQRSVRRCA